MIAELGQAEDVAQNGEVVVVQADDVDKAVGGGKNTGRVDAQRALRAEQVLAGQAHVVKRRRAAQQAVIDMASLARGLPRPQGGLHGLQVIQRRGQIDDRHPGAVRDVVGAAVDRHEARKCLQHAVGGGALAQRPFLPEAGHRQVDDARVEVGNHFVAEPEALDDAGPEALHEDVRLGCELAHDRHALGGFQVHHDAALAEVGDDERGRHVAERPVLALGAHPVAALRFDLDHVGSLLRQQRRGVGAGNALAQVEHLDAGVWLGIAHGFLLTTPPAAGCRRSARAGRSDPGRRSG